MSNKETTHFLDVETGEVVGGHISITKSYRTSDEFIQVYLEDMAGLIGVTSRSEMQLLMFMWKHSDFLENMNSEAMGNAVTITPLLRLDLQKATAMKDGTIRNTLTTLCKKGVIIKSNLRATYYLNPKYFFKGKLSERNKAFTVSLNYNNISED